MALVLSLSHIQDNKCSTWTLTDTTGVFESTHNPSGWKTTTSGGNNIQIDNNTIVQAKLIIAKPNGTSYTFNLLLPEVWNAITPFENDPFDASTDPNYLKYIIPAALIGGTIEDGIYTVVYSITNNTGTKVESIFTVCLYCNVECCVYKIVYAIPENYFCQNCNDTFVKDVCTTWALYLALMYSARIGEYTRFSNLLTALKQICASSGCASCS